MDSGVTGMCTRCQVRAMCHVAYGKGCSVVVSAGEKSV